MSTSHCHWILKHATFINQWCFVNYVYGSSMDFEPLQVPGLKRPKKMPKHAYEEWKSSVLSSNESSKAIGEIYWYWSGASLGMSLLYLRLIIDIVLLMCRTWKEKKTNAAQFCKEAFTDCTSWRLIAMMAILADFM